MTRVTLGKKTYDIPARWSEVTDRGLFVRLCGAMFDFETGAVTFDELRCRLAIAVLGLDVRRLKPSDTLYENIYRISEQVTFPYSVTRMPDGSTSVGIDIRMTDNLLPEISGCRGYRYTTSPSGIVDTDLTARQYVAALQLLQLYAIRLKQGSGRELLLDVLALLFRVLYRQGETGETGAEPSEEELVALLYNYRGIMATLQADPDYALIFAAESSQPSGAASPVGPQSAVFSLSKAGFGDIDTINALDVHTFLAAMVQQTLDSIRALAGAKMGAAAISEKLNLPLEQVLPFVTATED